MALRKRCDCKARCEHPWHYDFMLHGQLHRKSTGTSDKKLARDIEASARERVVRGYHKLPQGDITLREFWPTYLSSYAQLKHAKSTLVRTETAWKVLDRLLGSKTLMQLTSEEMGKFASARRYCPRL